MVHLDPTLQKTVGLEVGQLTLNSEQLLVDCRPEEVFLPPNVVNNQITLYIHQFIGIESVPMWLQTKLPIASHAPPSIGTCRPTTGRTWAKVCVSKPCTPVVHIKIAGKWTQSSSKWQLLGWCRMATSPAVDS